MEAVKSIRGNPTIGFNNIKLGGVSFVELFSISKGKLGIDEGRAIKLRDIPGIRRLSGIDSNAPCKLSYHLKWVVDNLKRRDVRRDDLWRAKG